MDSLFHVSAGADSCWRIVGLRIDPPARKEALGDGPRNGVCTETPTVKKRELAGRMAATHSPLRIRAPDFLIR